MIYEIRTYQLAPGSQAEVEKRYGEAYQYRKKYSELTGFFHTEIGPLNEIIHIWRYSDLAERARIRADRKSTRLNSSHSQISYAVFCLKKKNKNKYEKK